VKIGGKQHYLWRVVDQDGEVVDVFLQERQYGKVAKRFFRRLLQSHVGEPRKIVMDKLRSYGVAHRELIPETIHDTSQYVNNRAEGPGDRMGNAAVQVTPGRLSILSVFTLPSTNCSISGGTLLRLSTSETLGEVRLHVGKKQWPNSSARNLAFVETLICQYR
jgi:hypothetical protein